VSAKFLSSYSDVQPLDALERPRGGAPTYRAVQVRALKEHITQRDATLVAVENLTSQRWEYYVATFWQDPAPLDRFLATW
jgi:hypothetical protein